MEGQRDECWSMSISDYGEILTSSSQDRMIRVWRRTDEPLFLDEEKDKGMQEFFESKLIEDDVLQANKDRKGYADGDEKEKRENLGFMYDENKMNNDLLSAGKRSMETVKGGESILEALGKCEEEKYKEDHEKNKNPIMFDISEELYLLRRIEKIPTSELEESMQIIPLD